MRKTGDQFGKVRENRNTGKSDEAEQKCILHHILTTVLADQPVEAGRDKRTSLS